MRVLVTGAGGFAGGHLARRLAADGFDVFAATRRSTVVPPSDADAARRFHIVSGALEETRLPEVEAIVHAAATSPWPGVTIDAMLTDNVVATRSLIRQALAGHVRSFVFLSSISAMGTIGVSVLDETAPSVDPDAYGATKLFGEWLLAEVADALPSLSIRLPAVIGRGSARNWPSECFRKLRRGLLVEPFNPDARFNNVVHERDLAVLVAGALRAPPAGAEMVVVGSAGETSVRDVVRILADGSGATAPVRWSEKPACAFTIDSGKAARLLAYRPMTIEAALESYVRDETAG